VIDSSCHIIVDLDGTLVRTDLFLEASLRLIKQNPLNVFRLAFWLRKGRAHVKDRVAQRVDISAEFLPYNEQLLDYLRDRKRQGHRLILATASNISHAEAVARHLAIFDCVIASDATNNMKGVRKLAAIRELLGDDSFAYAGNSAADRPLWDAAEATIMVEATRRDVEKARAEHKVEIIIASDPGTTRNLIRAMRPLQWAKNLLILVPVLTSHLYHSPGVYVTASLAFVCFSLCASGVYLLNDLLDLDADRQHETKRKRPLAAGDISIPMGIIAGIALPVAAFAIAWSMLPLTFLAVLGLYYIITLAYSFYLKAVSIADVMTLAVLYTLRVVAGAAALDIMLSSWLMAFSMFTFVSLAYLKRYVETAAPRLDAIHVPGRGYSRNDSETLFSLGIANMTASVVVLALYINSDEISVLYNRSEILWLLCFLMLYWGNHIWISARRGIVSEDPIIFALKDKVSRAVGVGFLVVVLTARYVG